MILVILLKFETNIYLQEVKEASRLHFESVLETIEVHFVENLSALVVSNHVGARANAHFERVLTKSISLK